MLQSQSASTPPVAAASRLDPRVSLAFLVLWVAVMVQGWSGIATEGPTAQLYYPAATAARLTSRTLELADAIEAAPAQQREFWQRFEYTPAEALHNAIAIHEDLIAMLESSGDPPLAEPDALDRARAGLAVLLAESGQTPEALARAAQVSDLGNYAGLLEQLYRNNSQSQDLGQLQEMELDFASASLETWPSSRLQLRSAEKLGNTGGAEQIQGESAQLGARLLSHTRTLFFANWGLVFLGLVTPIAWLSLRGSDRVQPNSVNSQPAPWSFADGLGVLIRGDFYNRLYFVVLAELPHSLSSSPLGDALHAAGTPLASLPMLWLIYRHLITPHRHSHPDSFGIDPRRASWGLLAGFALAAVAAELLGTQAIGWASYFMDVTSPWSEGFDETLVWAFNLEMLLTSVDYIVWIPVFEELTFRGLLYFTLRRRLGVLAAATLSSAIFSGAHFYSITGFLTTFWSAMVWAIVFERVRSLIPGIAAHAVYNGLYVASLLLLYR